MGPCPVNVDDATGDLWIGFRLIRAVGFEPEIDGGFGRVRGDALPA